MKKENQTFLKGIAVGALVTIGVILIFVRYFENQNYGKLKVIEGLINSYYLEDVQEDTLENGIYAGVVESLGDKYSTYYTEEEYKSLQESTQGQYLGIGVIMQQDKTTGIVSILKCYDNSPAVQAGLQDGDVISKINGEVVENEDLTEVSAAIKKAENDTVTITVQRDGEYLDFEVTRAEVEVPLVSYHMEEDAVGYVHILQFSQVTFEQFQQAMKELQSQGMKRLILDLRDNPGGLVSSVCDIADTFLDKEELIVYTEDKEGEKVEYCAEEEKQYDYPMVVLVNKNSASSSEIFTGMVKDYQLATVVGETTYGKGIVQKTYELKDGSAVKLTNSKYYTPNGNNIHGTGITPDIEIALEENQEGDEQLQKAMEILLEK